MCKGCGAHLGTNAIDIAHEHGPGRDAPVLYMYFHVLRYRVSFAHSQLTCSSRRRNGSTFTFYDAVNVSRSICDCGLAYGTLVAR